MTTTAYWMPNQATVAQVETYTFGAPSVPGSFYSAAINGKVITYLSVSGDTPATVMTGLLNLLNQSTNIFSELTEITFAGNATTATMTATAGVLGTPFANVSGGSSSGLVLSASLGAITTQHTTPNASPSDVNDPLNWLRVTSPAPGVRQLPQNGDVVVIANTAVPLLWNLDQLAAVQFASYQRWQSFTGTIGLPENNPNGYVEWRATYFKFVGPQGSVPAGGLAMVLGQGSVGGGPTRERYNVGSQLTTLTILGAGSPSDEYGVRFLGVHTQNTVTLLGGVSLGIAMLPGEISTLNSSLVDGSGLLGIGPGVTWSSGATLTLLGGGAILNAAPTTLALSNGAQTVHATDGLTWPTITAQNGSAMTWLAGGMISSLTMTTSSTLDKSQDARQLTITNSTMDGDSCSVNDPLNAISYTNATVIKQQVTSGPFTFTGPRTMKVV